MSFLDAHCHLGHADFNKDAPAVIERGRAAGLSAVITCGGSRAETARCLELAAQSNGLVRVAASLEPFQSGSAKAKEELDFLEQNLPRFCALGETGLDSTYPVPAETQEKILQAHVELAREHKLSVVIHARGTEERVLQLMARAEVPWVWHFFTKHKWLQPALDAGALLSLPTVKSRELDKICSQAPLEGLLCETDSPFAWKEGRNEPANVLSVYERVARAKEVELAEVAQIVEKNAARVFKL